MNRNIDTGGEAPTGGGTEETGALVRELIEALTALGNYLETAKHLSTAEFDAAQETLTMALARSTEQFERSVATARRLRDLVRRESKGDP